MGSQNQLLRFLSQAWIGLVCCSLILDGQRVDAIQLDLSNKDSIVSAAKIAADGMMSFYTGNQTGQIPGLLPQPYYWWEAGAMFGSLIDYWYYTNNSDYNDIVTQAMLSQVGPDSDFMPPNQTSSEGNDDQSFWAFAAMSAAERKFPDPPAGQPQWLALAQAVFNLQAERWDTKTCGGGLHWQIFQFNKGWSYKNTISNGCFFNLASRLARYTGNATYADWATKIWDWTQATGLMTPSFDILDGSDTATSPNCTDHVLLQWTYNAGVFMYGAANMYTITGDQKWLDNLNGIIAGANVFFQNNIMWEAGCEGVGRCDLDQRSFKAYLARWMAATVQLVPSTQGAIMPKLQASAQAAAQQCTGGPNGTTCGIRWTVGNYDGSTGVGEQMSALEVIQGNLVSFAAPPPVTNSTGGTSQGNPSAGTDDTAGQYKPVKITTGDRVGATILTILIVGTWAYGLYWMAFSKV